MDLHQLQNIVNIAEERSITKAAEKSFITQSALNQQLQRLEEELGTPLFIRARGNWQPTEAGQAYLETARQMLLMKEDTYNRIADCAEQNRRRLTVGLIPERGVDMFTSIYPAFHAEFPAVQVEPVECSVSVMLRMLTDGQLNLGLATLVPSQRDDNVYHPMMSEEIVLAVPAEHPLSEGGSQDWHTAPITALSRFAEEDFVRIYRRSTLYSITQALFDEAGFSPRVLFYTSSAWGKFRIVASGFSCALLPVTYAASDPRVRYFRLPQHPQWDVVMCSRKGAYLGKPESCFIRLAKAYWQQKLGGEPDHLRLDSRGASL